MVQGCALTAPGRLRRLTFGFGRMRKIPRSPGQALWLVVFLADKAAKDFNMLLVTVYETSQKMFFLRTKQSVQSFTCNIIRNFARYGRQPYEFRFFFQEPLWLLFFLKKIALNLERGVWHFLVIVLKSCYFCSDSGKAWPAKR